MKELLEPTIEHDDEDDNYGGGEFNDVSAVAVAAVDVAVAAAASKSTIDDDNYHSNDDGDDGSGSSGKCSDKNYDDDDDGGGNVVQQGKDCTILMTMTFWMTFLMMITSRSIFRAFRMSPLAIAIVIESWEDPSLLAQMQPKRRRKATNLNGRHLPTPIVARSWLLCPL